MRYQGGSLGWEAGAFVRMLFFLLPAIALYTLIGWWALIPCAAFWLAVIGIFALVRKHRS